MTADERAVQRMMATALTIRENLAGRPLTKADAFEAYILRTVEFELAERMDDVRRARDLLHKRGDANGLALSAYADELLIGYEAADKQAATVLKRAGRGRS